MRGVDNDRVHEGIGGRDDRREVGRAALLKYELLAMYGKLQREGQVRNLISGRLEDLTPLLGSCGRRQVIFTRCARSAVAGATPVYRATNAGSTSWVHMVLTARCGSGSAGGVCQASHSDSLMPRSKAAATKASAVGVRA